MVEYTRVNADQLRTFMAAVFVTLNVPEEDALTAADVLVRADLRGVESHGVNNFPSYIRGLKEGRLNPRPTLTCPFDSPVNAVVDGDGGMGLVVGVKAMDLAIAKAQSCGIGAVAVRRSMHYGMASYHAMRALAHDMIGYSFTNNAGAVVAPTYACQPMLSTNPISMAVPAGQDIPFVLDMATSVIAYGKVKVAHVKGQSIPQNWILDKDGNPTTNPQDLLNGGVLLPLGGTPDESNHKGYGLGVMVDILTGLLSGGIYGNRPERKPHEDEVTRRSASHFFLAFRIDYFRPLDEFKADMDDMLSALRGAAKAPGQERIYTHGEKEYEAEQDRGSLGIPYHPTYIQQLREIGTEREVTFPY